MQHSPLLTAASALRAPSLMYKGTLGSASHDLTRGSTSSTSGCRGRLVLVRLAILSDARLIEADLVGRNLAGHAPDRDQQRRHAALPVTEAKAAKLRLLRDGAVAPRMRDSR